jgi:hypothetical protein
LSGFAGEGIGLDVIQAPKPEPRMMRHELTDFEWAAISSFLPNKPRGIPRVACADVATVMGTGKRDLGDIAGTRPHLKTTMPRSGSVSV